MKRSLKFKLSLSYALVALLLVATISLFSNFFLERQFEQYIIRQQESKNEEIALQLAQQYDLGTNSFDLRAVEAIGVAALERGMIVRLSSTDGAPVWDAREHNSGLCNQMLESMAASMQSRYGNFQGEYEERLYPVALGSTTVGSVRVGYYGPFYYTDNDAAFIDTLNRALAVIGALSLAGAVLLGLLMAMRISRPIAQTIGAAEQIAKGNYKVRLEPKTGTRELDSLIRSIASLSSALESQDALRKRLSADIAHELRTPLSTLQGNLEAMIDGVWESDALHLQSCHEETLRLARLVSGLENLARLESENAALDRTRFDLKELAEKAALSFEPLFLEKKVRLSVTGGPRMIYADQDKIRQVLINLLSNSLNYTPAGGWVAVRISGEGGYAGIEVQDSGAGIAKEHLPHIFERFYRADASRSSKSGGAGIGLAVVKTIVETHGGKITAESEPGKGARFFVRLPEDVQESQAP